MPNLDSLLTQVDSAYDDIVALEQGLVQIPSVNTGFMPTGHETTVCDFVRNWLAEDDIKCEILERAKGRGNLIARYDGNSGNTGLLYMSHTDVVPVEDESKWTFPPFSATVSNGRVYGRGASDCKGLLTAQLMAMRLLARNDVNLNDSLILASGADEEHGGRYGFGWLAENHPDKIRAPFAINEGGGTPIQAGGNTVFVVGTGEKGRLQVEIDIKGTSAHASVPWQGTNALYGLAKVIRRIEEYEAERDVSTSLFQHLSTFAIEHKPSSNNIDEIISEMEEENPPLANILRSLSRMTLTPTIVHGGIKSNSVPESIRLTCDVRTLPHQNESYIKKELAHLLDGIPDIDFKIDYMAVPNSSPFETDFVKRIRVATEKVLGRNDYQWVPGIATGFTDSRFTRSLGVKTYGFSGVHPDDDPSLLNVHGTNESESIKSLVNGTKIMLALAYNLLATE